MNNRKDNVSNTVSTKEQVTATTTGTNESTAVHTMTIGTYPIEKAQTRSISLLQLNKLIDKQAYSQPPTLPPIDGGDELNETSFRDADDNYQCLINDQNCPPISNFSKVSTSSSTNSESMNNTNGSPVSMNKDDRTVFATSPSTANKKTDLDSVERFKMCGNSIVA